MGDTQKINSPASTSSGIFLQNFGQAVCKTFIIYTKNRPAMLASPRQTTGGGIFPSRFTNGRVPEWAVLLPPISN
jgi:hypothetical protein